MSYLLRRPVQYQVTAGGYAQDKSLAFLGLMGETLERYASAFPASEEIITGSYQDLLAQNKSAIAPGTIALFHEKQYQKQDFLFAPLTETYVTDWTPMIHLNTGKQIYYPASLVYMPYFSKGDDKAISASQSTGLAAHTSASKALLLALYEVIERDGFAISWHQKIPLQKIRLEGWIAARIKTFFSAPCEIHLLDMSLDGCVPSVAGLLFGKNSGGDFVVCAAATRWNYEECITKTLSELAQGVPYATFLSQKYKNWEVAEDYSNVDDFDKHAALYNKKKTLWQEHINSWRSTPPTLSVPADTAADAPRSDEERLRFILAHMQRKGYDVLAKDLTTADSEQLGFRVLRALIPQAIPLGGDNRAYYLGGQRLYTVPQQLGHPVCSFEALNICPHPFP